MLSRSVGPLFALLLSLSGCGVGLCLTQFCSMDGLSISPLLDFGARSFGSTHTQALLVSNNGRSSMTGFSATGIDTPFSFAGGSFPGVGGTCTDSLGAGQSCTLMLEFTAGSTFAIHEQTLTLRFSIDSQLVVLTTQVTATSDNGSFNIARGLNDSVFAVAADSNRVFVGGAFLFDSDKPQGRFAVYRSDGTADTTFEIGTGFSDIVRTIALTPEGIYVGGDFQSYAGTPANHIVRLNEDGSVDSAFYTGSGVDLGFNATVSVITPTTDGTSDIYVGGSFTSYRGTTGINRIVRLRPDGSVQTSFATGTGFNGAGVGSIAIAPDGSGDIYVGGAFSTYGAATNVNRIVRLDATGNINATFNIGAGATAGFPIGTVYTIVPAPDASQDIYVGGSFSSYNTVPNRRNILRLSSTGAIVGSFNIGAGASAGFDGAVYSILPASDMSGRIYVGGVFSSYNSTANLFRLVRLNADGTRDATFDAGFPDLIAKPIYSLASASDGSTDFYVGGDFGSDYKTKYLARIREGGSAETEFNEGLGSVVGFNNVTFAATPVPGISGSVYVGGSFTSYNGTSAIRIARLKFDGSLDPTFNTGSGFSGGVVRAILPAPDGSGDIYVGGEFDSYNGSSNIRKIVRLRADGTINSTFDIGTGASAGFSGNVRCLAATVDGSGDILVGGNFFNYNGNPNVNRIARLRANGSLNAAIPFGAPTSGFHGASAEILAIAPVLDGSGTIYVGGNYDYYNGTSDIYGLVRLLPNGAIDPAFDIGTGTDAAFGSLFHLVTSLALTPSGDLYVGGGFIWWKGQVIGGMLVRLKPDGSIDSGFQTGLGSPVWSLALSNDGSQTVYASGSFGTYQGTPISYGIVRIDADGTLNAEFNAGSGVDASEPQVAAAGDGSGDVYVYGSISFFNNASHDGMARVSPQGNPD